MHRGQEDFQRERPNLITPCGVVGDVDVDDVLEVVVCCYEVLQGGKFAIAWVIGQ